MPAAGWVLPGDSVRPLASMGGVTGFGEPLPRRARVMAVAVTTSNAAATAIQAAREVRDGDDRWLAAGCGDVSHAPAFVRRQSGGCCCWRSREPANPVFTELNRTPQRSHFWVVRFSDKSTRVVWLQFGQEIESRLMGRAMLDDWRAEANARIGMAGGQSRCPSAIVEAKTMNGGWLRRKGSG